MSYLSKTIKNCVLFLLIMSLGLVACSSTADEYEESTPTSDPTPELAVVVFATEAPSANTPTPLPSPTSTLVTVAEPIPAATAGSGISQSTTDDGLQVTTSVGSAPKSRPSDINPLTGLKVADPALLERRPLMVRIGNDPTARPQMGLNQADMIYEEMTEWWVTRFTAIYLANDPDTIAPIRSARLINVQLVPQYQGALANSGGSDGVRWELSQTDLINIDEYFIPAPYFYRPNQGWQTRLAIDASKAREYLNDEGLDYDVNLRGFNFSNVPDLSAVPPGTVSDALEATIPYPKRTTQTTWRYDPSSGKYLRFIDGEPFVDAQDNQVAASNVIIYFADHQETDIVEDSNGATSIRMIVAGEGPAWLLRDGKIAKGKWSTNGQETPLFTFADGQPMWLKPGNTWVSVVPLEYAIDINGDLHSLTGIVTPAEEETEEASDETEESPSEESTVAAEATEEPTATPESQE